MSGAAARTTQRPLLHLRTRFSLWRIAAAFIVLMTVVAVAAPLLAPQDPEALNLNNAYAPPSGSNLLGADESGRDLLSRLMWGARPTLLGPLLIILVATGIGSALAILSAWRGGWVDAVINSLFNVVFAFPAILLAVLAAAVFGKGFLAAVIALSIAYVPYVGRIVRGEALKQRSMQYIEATQVQGLRSTRIAMRHLLPNVAPLIIAQATVTFGYAMVDLAAVSYLGLGVQPPTPDWGLMVAEGQEGLLIGEYAQSLLAGGLIIATVISFTVLGDKIAERTSGLR